jgi:hypothetical protein
VSQIYKPLTSSGPIPGNIVTQVNTQSGNAVPLANVLLLNAYDTTENNDNGIETKGGVAGGDPPGTGATNETDVYLTNRTTGTATTTDATLTTVITFPLGAVPGTFYFYGNVQAFNSSNPASGAYSYSGGFRTDGATATELGTELHDEFEDPVLVNSDIFISASANNVILSVQGIAATTINWNALMEYRRVI